MYRVTLNSKRTNNFVRISQSIALELRVRSSSLPACFSLHPCSSESKLYVGWNGETISSDGDIDISSETGRMLGLIDGEMLDIVYEPSCSFIETLVVEPSSAADWEIVELNANYVQNYLLEQLSIVSLNQTFPIFMGPHLVAYFRAATLYLAGGGCAHFGKLGTASYVSIAPKHQVKNEEKVQDSSSLDVLSVRVQRNDSLLFRGDIAKLNSAIECAFDVGDIMGLNVGDLVLLQSNTAQQIVFCLLSSATKDAHPGHVIIPEEIRKHLGVQYHERLLLKRISSNNIPYLPRSITLHPVSANAVESIDGGAAVTTSSLIDLFVHHIKCGASPTVMSSGMIYTFPNLSNGQIYKVKVIINIGSSPLSLKGESPLYFVMFPNVKYDNKITFLLGDHFTIPDIKNDEMAIVGIAKEQDYCEDLYSLELGQLITHIKCSLTLDGVSVRLKLGTPAFGFPYLVGGVGAGKTSTLHYLSHWCDRVGVAVQFISCKELTGKGVKLVMETLQHALDRSLALAPCILLLDDIDALMPSEESFASHGASSSNHSSLIVSHALSCWLTRVVDKYHTTMSNIQKRSSLSLKDILDIRLSTFTIIASGISPSSLNNSLLRSGLFENVIKLPSLDSSRRALLIEHLLHISKFQNSRSVDFKFLSNSTEGASAKDIDKLVRSAVRHCVLRIMDSLEGVHELVTPEDFLEALSDWQPLALRDVKLTSSSVRWQDVGGLDIEKNMLKETFELPMKYRQLYDNSPIPLAKGVLLYGRSFVLCCIMGCGALTSN
jgi:SpoVK/Ycf46/Vps4 family AAA+-type ATPase